MGMLGSHKFYMRAAKLCDVAYNVMMKLILTMAVVLALLLANEIWWQRKAIQGEFSRKFIHITVGSFVAFWPFFLSWHAIEFLSLAFLLVVSVSKKLQIFKAIHSVQRPTWGEVLFAAAVGITALITHNKWIYAAALLQMSLADGLAAVLGIRYGGGQRYSVFGHAKSVLGTATFVVVSLLIFFSLRQWGDLQLSISLLLATSVLAGILENFSGGGFDNLLVPVLAALLLVHA
jgi:phytol kinase